MAQIWEYKDAWSFRHGAPKNAAPVIEIEIDEGIVACLTRPGTHPLDPQQPPSDNIVTAEVYFLKRTFRDLATAACWHDSAQIVFDAAAAAGPLLGAITWRAIADAVIPPTPPVTRRISTKRANQRPLFHPPSAWQARMLPVGLWLPEQDMVARVFNDGWPVDVAHTIATEITRSARGVTACSVLTNIYRPNDFADHDVDTKHLQRIRANAGDISAITLSTPPTHYRPPAHTALATVALLPIAVETWRTRDLLTDGVPRVDWWGDLLSTSLNLPSETILHIWPTLCTYRQIAEMLDDMLRYVQEFLQSATGVPVVPLRYADHRTRN